MLLARYTLQGLKIIHFEQDTENERRNSCHSQIHVIATSKIVATRNIMVCTREMQSINGASLRVLDSLIERIALKTFES